MQIPMPNLGVPGFGLGQNNGGGDNRRESRYEMKEDGHPGMLSEGAYEPQFDY